MNSLVKYALDHGGKDYNLYYPTSKLGGKYNSCNTACIYTNHGLLMASRAVNYRKIFQSKEVDYCSDLCNQTYIFNRNGVTSRTLMMVYNNGNFNYLGECICPKSEFWTYYMGLEDCRFVCWNNKIYMYGTRWDKLKDLGCICIYELDNSLRLVNEVVVEPPFDNYCEKNWCAIEGEPFKFVYTVNPLTILEVDKEGKCTVVRKDEYDHSLGEEFIKGNTPLVRYSDDEYISIVHITPTTPSDWNRVYNYHSAFIFYDNDFNVTRKSDWFVFKSETCEFSCGISVNNDDIYITYSQLDGVSNLLVTDKETIEKFMKDHTDRNDTYTFDYFYDLAHEYETNGQVSSAYILYNYCSILGAREKVDYERQLECVIKGFCGIVVNLDIAISTELYWVVNDNLQKQIANYPDACELYYISAYLFKEYDWNSYLRYKQLGDERKMNMHSYFLKYFDPNCL